MINQERSGTSGKVLWVFRMSSEFLQISPLAGRDTNLRIYQFWRPAIHPDNEEACDATPLPRPP